MRTAFSCFIKGACASRARIRNSSDNAEFTIGFTSCNTRNRSCTFRWMPTARLNPPCYRPVTDPCGGTEMPPIPLLLSAGEASGDMYAARLATALKQRLDVAIFGMGGPQMRAAGVEIITDYSEVSVVGITEVLKRLPSLFRAMERLVTEAERRHPPGRNRAPRANPGRSLGGNQKLS